jgi:hypothetical protein
VDTPGFDDPKVPDNQILKLIADYLLDAFENGVEIMGALYVHHITAPRMYRSGMRNLMMFKEVVGLKNMKNVRLVTTKWQVEEIEMAKNEANERQLASDNDKWKPLLAAGATMARFEDSQQSAWQILAPLIQDAKFMPQVLEEIVVENKPLPQTGAGIRVTDNIEDVYEAKTREVNELKAFHEQEKDTMSAEFEENLFAETRKAEAALAQAHANRKEWKALDDKRRQRGRIGRWFARGSAIIGGTLLTVFTAGLGGPAAVALYGAVEGGAQIHKDHENERTRTGLQQFDKS